MTKPKGGEPVRERAAKGDTSNEGAQAERDAVRAYIKRLRRECEEEPPRDMWQRAQGETLNRILKWLDGRTARFAARKGGLRGPGKVARRA